MPPSDRLKQKVDVIAQRATADLVLFDLDSGNYYALNELGARIWELCDGNQSLADIAGQLESEYEAPRAVIEQDLEELVAGLLENGLLIRMNENVLAG